MELKIDSGLEDLTEMTDLGGAGNGWTGMSDRERDASRITVSEGALGKRLGPGGGGGGLNRSGNVTGIAMTTSGAGGLTDENPELSMVIALSGVKPVCSISFCCELSAV